MNEKLYSIKEFLEIFDISRDTFYNWKERGVVHPMQVDRTIRIPESEVKRIQHVDDKLYSINEFCKYFSITRFTFYNWKERGIIKSIQIGGTVRIPESEVRRIVSLNSRVRVLDDDMEAIKSSREEENLSDEEFEIMEKIPLEAPNTLIYPLRMLKYLRLHGQTKMEELATVFDITPRMIRRYVYTLKESGYPIKSKAGKHGGYYLDEPTLTDSDWVILKAALVNHPELYAKVEVRLLEDFTAKAANAEL